MRGEKEIKVTTYLQLRDKFMTLNRRNDVINSALAARACMHGADIFQNALLSALSRKGLLLYWVSWSICLPPAIHIK